MPVTFKIDIKAARKLRDTTRIALFEITRSNALMAELSNAMIDDIKFQTRRGISIPTGSKFKELSSRWKTERAKIASVMQPADVYSQNRSNLSLIGELLDSLKFKIPSPGVSRIYFDGTHQAYRSHYVEQWKRKNRSGVTSVVKNSKAGVRKAGKSLRNEDLARYVQEQGRPFFGLRESLKPRLLNIVRAFYRRTLKRIAG